MAAADRSICFPYLARSHLSSDDVGVKAGLAMGMYEIVVNPDAGNVVLAPNARNDTNGVITRREVIEKLIRLSMSDLGRIHAGAWYGPLNKIVAYGSNAQSFT